MTDQIHVLPLYKNLKIMSLLFPPETLTTLKFPSQTQNLNIISCMTLTVWCTMLHMKTILSLQNPLYLQIIFRIITMIHLSFTIFTESNLYENLSSISTITKSLYNVQPTSHNTKPRIFPSLPYIKENLKFINKFNFQLSDLTYKE